MARARAATTAAALGLASRRCKPEPLPLVDALKGYLERNPNDSDKTPYWLGATLWCDDLTPGKPTPAAVAAALEKLRSRKAAGVAA